MNPMYLGKIEQDRARFRKIIKGKIKQDLQKYITRGELIGRKGRDLVSIPIPQIEIPHFKYGSQKQGGVGQGEGEQGTPLFPAEGKEGQGQAGSMPGEHILEVDISIEELAQILAEELELPNIKPRGKKNITEEKEKYTGISKAGPESLRHFKRTYKEALKRQIITGTYEFSKPRIVPIKEDKRYRSWKLKPSPEANAVIIYMMDVSGSMGDEQKDIVRMEAFWIDAFLQSQYKEIKTVYITHDAEAREVDKHTFYHSRESGGTLISSAYELCRKKIEEEFSPEDWNIYAFHFSDGDNWGNVDTERSISLLKNELLPRVNLFGYGQVKTPYGSGKFIHALGENLEDKLSEHIGDGEHKNLILSEIPDKEGIYDSIKDFLGKGK